MPSKFKERVCIGFDAQGNPIYKWVCGVTRQEIIREAARVLLQYGLIEGQQTQKPPDSPFFKTYIAEWFRLYKENKLRQTTKTGYQNLIQKHIIPFFGSIRLEDINTSVLQEFYNAHSHLAQSTVRQMSIILHQVFDLAVEDDYMKKNPTNSKRVFISAKKAAKREALGEEHIVQIMAALPRLQETDRMVMALLLFTGLRRGEVLGLRWEDIDWIRGMIRVERAVTFKDNRPHLGPPKSEAGNRIVPLTKELMQILKPLRQLGGFIIGGSEPISEMTFKRMWERIGKTVDLRGATPHVFRHTFITLAASSGMDIKTLQGIAGHSDVRMTIERYAHVRVEKVKEAGAQIEAVFEAL